MATDLDIAWCAGLYEGEGCVIYGASHKGPIRVRISSTDRDVLLLAQARSGVGAVSGPYPPNGFGKKDFHNWTVNGHAAVDLLHAMAPWLGERRRARALEKIALWEQRPQRHVADQDAMRADRASGMTYADVATKHGVTTARAFQVCKDGKRVHRRWGVAPE